MGKPFSAMLRARFWPITARPASPMRERAVEASMPEEGELGLGFGRAREEEEEEG